MQSEPLEQTQPESSSRAQNIASAEAALIAAGSALEPNGQNPQDLPRAAALLEAGLGMALAELSDARPIPKLEARARESLRSLARSSRPLPDDLHRAELVLAELVEHANGGRSLGGARIRSRLAVGAVVLAIVCSLAYATVVWAASSDGLRFRTSSADWGFRRTGKLGHQGVYGLLFHTKEEDHPWVEIDLGKPRTIHRIVVENRRDCCTERAIPLVIEVRDGAGDFHEVGRRDEAFDTWTADFPAEEATRVRLVVEKTTAMHLAGVRIQ